MGREKDRLGSERDSLERESREGEGLMKEKWVCENCLKKQAERERERG